MDMDSKVNSIQNMILDDLSTGKEAIFNGLVTTHTHNSIPESLFVEYFLPHFLGIGTNPNWVNDWISIAGSPSSKMNVVANGTNTVLFTVPELMNTSNVFTGNRKGGISDFMYRHEILKERNPSASMDFLLDALEYKYKEMVNEDTNTEAKEVWKQILIRYNLLNKDIKTTTSDDNQDDFFQY